MEGLELILDNIGYNKFNKGTEHWVQVTRVISPHQFYVHPTKYLPFIERLESLRPSTKPSSLNINDIVIFNMHKSIDNPKYSRGIITSINIDKDDVMCDIFALDYGQFCTKMEQEHIWDCNGSLAKLPAMALECELANCEVQIGDRWTEDIIDAFKYCAISEPAKMTILDKKFDKLIVELKNSSPYDIATMMAMAGISVLRYDENGNRKTIFPVTPEHSDIKKINVKLLHKKCLTI